MCNCNNRIHRLETVTNNGTNVILTVTNSTNISNKECFELVLCGRNIDDFVTGAPIPVLVNINGADVALLNKYSEPVMSNRVPRRSQGAYVVPTSGSPYVILFTTPYCKCYAQ